MSVYASYVHMYNEMMRYIWDLNPTKLQTYFRMAANLVLWSCDERHANEDIKNGLKIENNNTKANIICHKYSLSIF